MLPSVRFLLFSTMVAANVLASMPAAADDAQPPPAATAQAAPVPQPAPAADADDQARYHAARDLLVEGLIGRAAEAFEELARTTRDPVLAKRAAEDAAVCRVWLARGLVLVKRSDLGESTIAARASNERTTDELAVLYTNAVFYGLGAGAWLATLTEPDSAAGGVVPALGLAGAAALGVYGLDRGRPLRYGVPQSIVTGLYVGLEQGIAWTVWNQSRFRRSESWDADVVASVIFGSATAGGIVGGLIGTAHGTTPGRASFVGSAALWSGVVAGLFTAGVSPDDPSRDDRSWLAAGLGVTMGAIGGALTAGHVSPTIARVRFLDLGAIGGALLGGGLFLASESDDASVGTLVTAGGIAAGLGIAWAATSGMPEDRPEQKPAAAHAFAPSVAVSPTKGGGMVVSAFAF